MVDHCRECRDRPDNALTQRNDDEQAVSLSDVMRMPRRPAGLPLRKDGTGQLNQE